MITWSSWSPYAISGCCNTYIAVLDLGTMAVTSYVLGKKPYTHGSVQHDMFCPGASQVSVQCGFRISERQRFRWRSRDRQAERFQA